MKICSICQEIKPFSEYWVTRNGRTRDGYKGECKECAKARRRDWAANNREQETKWNREKYLTDPIGFVERADKWRKENPDRYRELNRNREGRRRANKRANYVEDVISLVLLELDDGICGICGDDVDPFDFHVDHIIPLSRGGEHSYANTQVAHPTCNLKKGARV